MKRIWEWLKSIPVIGWILVGGGLLLGRLFGSRTRPGPVSRAGTLDPDALEAERKRVAAELDEARRQVKEKYTDLQEESDKRWDSID